MNTVLDWLETAKDINRISADGSTESLFCPLLLYIYILENELGKGFFTYTCFPTFIIFDSIQEQWQKE